MPEHGKLDDLTARIEAAQAARGTGRKDGKGKEDGPVSTTRIGFDFMASVLGSAILGLLADRYLGTKPWGVIGMIVAGFAVGIVNVWRAMGAPDDKKGG